MSAKDSGLEARFHVKKIKDPAGKHDGCRYFVLDPMHDPIAEGVLRIYADEARRRGYEALADDLINWVGACPFYGKAPHDAHHWTDISIAGESYAECPGVPGDAEDES